MGRIRVPLVAVLAVGLAAVGAATASSRATNPVPAAVGLGVASNVESAALYCTGLSDARGGVGGRVVVLNTSGATRHLTISVASDTGQRATTSLALAPRSSASVRPSALATGHSFGVTALIDGGGVVAEEVLDNHAGVAPCSSDGVTSWYASGLVTAVGSSAQLSFYNPTATPAVVNVSVSGPGGFAAPPPFQGLPVGAHDEVVVNLGSQVVDEANVGVRVRVLRGAVEVVAVQRSGAVGSIDVGAGAPAASAWFPRVTTADGAVAQVRLANPGPGSAQVTLAVTLGSFRVPALTATVAAYSEAVVVVTPNSAIPAAGYATVRLTSTRPVVATLATGTSAGTALSPARAPSAAALLADLSGRGFDDAAITNTSSATVTVTLSAFDLTSHALVTSSTVRLDGHTTSGLLGLYGALRTLSHTSVLARASRPDLVVTATLTGAPAGVAVVTPLDGG